MATFDDLLPDILPEAPGCPDFVASQKLRDTLQHFCRESWFWQTAIDSLTLLPFDARVPGSYEYLLQAGDDVQVLGVIRLLYQHKELSTGAVSSMDAYCPGWREDKGPAPRMFLNTAPNKVRLVPASENTQPVAVTGEVAVMPTRNARAFGDDLLQFADAICAGTLARLQKMAGKEWRDPQTAQVNQALYLEGLSLAKLEAMREHQSDTPSLNPITLA